MNFAAAQAHGEIREVFPDVFFVTGTYEGELLGSHWCFSRNMTVVREAGNLCLINAVRLDEAGLLALEALGEVAHVMRIGELHGLDDAFYLDRYGAAYWAHSAMNFSVSRKPDHYLKEGGATPLPDASVFVFEHSKVAECVIFMRRSGGILIACDALQNWREPDHFISDDSRERMSQMGFFQSANIGPVWMQAAQPKVDDFNRLGQLDFQHVLCGHGEPLRDTAKQAYKASFARLFPQ